MNSRRTVILIVALVVGGIASFGLLNYIRNVEGSVYDNAEPESVWVVRQAIPKGTPAEQVINQGMIVASEIPASFRPATAIVNPETELAGLVAVTDLPINAPLVTGNFVVPSVVNTGITDRLEEKGLVTVTFSVDQVKGAAYLVEPGDYVNVLAVKPVAETGTALAESDVPETGQLAEAVPNGIFDFTARYVYQRSEVLAVDQALTPDLGEATDESQAGPVNGGLITLAVPPEAAQTILAVGLENIYLSLVPPTYVPAPLPPIDLDADELPGESEDQLTPYGPDPEVEDAR